MDDFTRAHLRNWILREHQDATAEERETVFENFRRFVEAHPVVLERGDGWPEIQKLVFRQIIREDKAARKGSRAHFKKG